jgi:hypothetical protein
MDENTPWGIWRVVMQLYRLQLWGCRARKESSSVLDEVVGRDLCCLHCKSRVYRRNWKYL